MLKRFLAPLVVVTMAVAAPLYAQRGETFAARLDWVPIGGADRNDVAGEGAASARLAGMNLTIAGSFAGLPANVTGAKLHQGVATGARGRGVAIAALRVTGDTRGTVAGEVQLTAEQVAALRAGHLYVQVYSEKGVDPDHATLWGWLLREGGGREAR
jgi:hypothetical protein